MLLKANKYRKDKKADCRQNKLGSRIFMGKVFGDYAECLHFYPSFSYGRIIAGDSEGRGTAESSAARSDECPPSEADQPRISLGAGRISAAGAFGGGRDARGGFAAGFR